MGAGIWAVYASICFLGAAIFAPPWAPLAKPLPRSTHLVGVLVLAVLFCGFLTCGFLALKELFG